MSNRTFIAPLGILVVMIIAVLVGLSLKPVESGASQPKKFPSYAELDNHVRAGERMARQFGGMYYGRNDMLLMNESMDQSRVAVGAMEKSAAPSPAPGAAADSAAAYSTTNTQVEGVDEADLVKSDGKYLYVVAGKKVFIMEAYPAQNAKLLGSISFEGQPADIFINGERLAVFVHLAGGDLSVLVYDLTDRSSPELKRTVTAGGNYVNARMVGDYIYLVVNVPVTRSALTGKIQLPRITTDGQEQIVKPVDVHYFDHPDYSYRFTMVMSLNIKQEGQEPVTRTFLTGVSQNLFASMNNIYLTNQKTPDYIRHTNNLLEGIAAALPSTVADRVRNIKNGDLEPDRKIMNVEQILEDYFNRLDYNQALDLEQKMFRLYEKYQRDLTAERNKTVIHKLAIGGGDVQYLHSGEVPGQVLNQFSMDEHQGYFRIATTTEGSFFGDGRTTRNHIYVMDQDLEIIGRLEGLAPTERIYSARFMGNRVYLVTFRQIDPLFVIDLKDPKKPVVLGELKIPGYSDYLHPYDENHIIGIGKEVPEFGPVMPLPEPMLRDQAMPRVMPPLMPEQGLKIALFDVTDPTEPKELAKYVVNRWDSDSPVLRDHRALLFNRELNLLAIPVAYTMDPGFQQTGNWEGYPPYKFWQGLYVFDISPAGITLRGSIDHDDVVPGGNSQVKRAMYIDQVLYTISDSSVKLNNLDDLKLIKKLTLQ